MHHILRCNNFPFWFFLPLNRKCKYETLETIPSMFAQTSSYDCNGLFAARNASAVAVPLQNLKNNNNRKLFFIPLFNNYFSVKLNIRIIFP